jgi:multidrug resistance efflux pump
MKQPKKTNSFRFGGALTILIVAAALMGCTDKPVSAWSGYAEGEYVYVAAPLAGRLDNVEVRAGQAVSKGAPLFSLDAESERLAQTKQQHALLVHSPKPTTWTAASAAKSWR